MGTPGSSSRRAASPHPRGQRKDVGAGGAGGAGGKDEAARPVARPSRPFEPGRAEPPLPITDDLEELVGPPLHGKTHPPADMDEVKPSLDDEVQRYRHHPDAGDTTLFDVDPDVADAAADLAGDLGSTFLEGATSGEDAGEAASELAEREESEVPFLIEEEPELDDESTPALVSPAPSPPGRGRRR